VENLVSEKEGLVESGNLTNKIPQNTLWRQKGPLT